ncbi:MAG: hypothetical protein COB85_09880 [Bacteroidetes bacterium]|nr:MAG: hypothetical protein COB85_09880 [Bacteroidota bacterium]
MARVKIILINTDSLSGKAKVIDVGVGEPNIRGRTLDFVAPEICETGGGIDSVFDCKLVYTHTIPRWTITGYVNIIIGAVKLVRIPIINPFFPTKMYVAIKFDIVVWD